MPDEKDMAMAGDIEGQQTIAVIAGATGIAGSAIVESLLVNCQQYSKIVVLSRKATGTEDDLRSIIYRDVTDAEAAVVQCVQADLLNLNIEALAKTIRSQHGNAENATTSSNVQLFYAAMFEEAVQRMKYVKVSDCRHLRTIPLFPSHKSAPHTPRSPCL